MSPDERMTGYRASKTTHKKRRKLALMQDNADRIGLRRKLDMSIHPLAQNNTRRRIKAKGATTTATVTTTPCPGRPSTFEYYEGGARGRCPGGRGRGTGRRHLHSWTQLEVQDKRASVTLTCFHGAKQNRGGPGHSGTTIQCPPQRRLFRSGCSAWSDVMRPKAIESDGQERREAVSSR
ncbi:hypothetical protein GWK47_010073 [Chionoecetes opilio]|uniref:Uncharacterized protein n=1 Tax=Chionoecetes opilio TaxID=41210 RepID=A0A8J5CQK0_CHIOP|nr:hypothetical protein GWK47_010073 [Chionoecetes opilio]